MARIEPIPIEQAEAKARELLDELVERGGEPGPMVRAMGRWMAHCHIAEHHESGMMLSFDVTA